MKVTNNISTLPLRPHLFVAPELIFGHCQDDEPLNIWRGSVPVLRSVRERDSAVHGPPAISEAHVVRHTPAGTTDSEWAALVSHAVIFQDLLAVAVLKSCLDGNVVQRLSAKQMLTHPWLSSAALTAPGPCALPELYAKVCHAAGAGCAS